MEALPGCSNDCFPQPLGAASQVPLPLLAGWAAFNFPMSLAWCHLPRQLGPARAAGASLILSHRPCRPLRQLVLFNVGPHDFWPLLSDCLEPGPWASDSLLWPPVLPHPPQPQSLGRRGPPEKRRGGRVWGVCVCVFVPQCCPQVQRPCCLALPPAQLTTPVLAPIKALPELPAPFPHQSLSLTQSRWCFSYSGLSLLPLPGRVTPPRWAMGHIHLVLSELRTTPGVQLALGIPHTGKNQ